MAAISPENLDDNTDSADPQKSSDLLENTVNLNTNYKRKYIGDFVECTDFPEEKKKIYYPYDLFIAALDTITLYRLSSSFSDIYDRYDGKDEVLPKLSYGVKEKVMFVGDKDLTSYFNKNGVGGTMHLTKYSGELDITLDDDGKEVYTLKKINSFIKRMRDKFGKCFSRRQSVQEGSSKKRAKKTRKQRKPRKSKRNHKK